MSLDPVLLNILGAVPVEIKTPVDWVEMRQVAKTLQPHVVGPEGLLPVRSATDVKIAGEAGDVSLRVYKPDQPSSTTLIYIHGGGWSLGDLDTVDHTVRKLCNDLPATVVSVTYRLAPEHRFPAAYNDVLAASHWVLDHVDELGGDPDAVLIGGDSAGGNLAAAVAIRLRDEAAQWRDDGAPRRPALKAQLLLYPATDLRPSALTTASCLADRDPSLPTQSVELCMAAYLGEKNMDDWRASPILADLSGLPPALVVVLEVDPLRDAGVEYAERMKAAGVHTELIEYSHLTHGFVHFAGIVPATRLAFDEVISRFKALADGRSAQDGSGQARAMGDVAENGQVI
ncbi:alpha/beta hydrolase [Massilia sp. GER05]|uniref:alpha/beta hydrolase n=1 Tax=Massilia sp. GER05 TaxID=3394605 RepID=UPI003F879991